ncbi:MAG: aldose 1-epimerase family protein [Firmicutes bacterium]|nr:aldose 1-epimerase family protein [Bacillota bacterium]
MNKYIGHSIQESGCYEYRLTGGKADGMRILRVKNGKGLDFEISLDRCADIVTLSLNGTNLGYMSACGYVNPKYYQPTGIDFLKSFSAGFFTTCGLTAVGSPCTDDGEELPLHGTISNTPSERYSVAETEENIIVKATVRDASIFSHQLLLMRTYTISKTENKITLSDTVKNIGSKKSPVMLLYHCNMGYPLLSENAEVVIPSDTVIPRNEHAKEDIENSRKMEKPQNGYRESCYYYDIKAKNGIGKCGIFNPDIEKGVVIGFDKKTLDYFTEWKMMGEYDYVLGLEPGNCTPDGRDVMRKEGKLKFIEPDGEYVTNLTFDFVCNKDKFTEEF